MHNPEGTKALVAEMREIGQHQEVFGDRIHEWADRLESLTAVAGDAKGVARELLADEYEQAGWRHSALAIRSGRIDRAEGIAFRAILRALSTRQAVETMPAPAPGCDTRHAVTFYFNDKAAAEQFRTRQAVEGMVQARAVIELSRDALAEELSAWDIDPPLAHVKEAHDKCEEWLAAAAPQAGKGE